MSEERDRIRTWIPCAMHETPKRGAHEDPLKICQDGSDQDGELLYHFGVEQIDGLPSMTRAELANLGVYLVSEFGRRGK